MSTDSTLCKFAKDTGIAASDIIAPYSNLTPENALLIKDEVANSEYISVRNMNNLSEVLIYRRTPYKSWDESVYQWDGVTTDTSWYDDVPDAEVYCIRNPDQLAGLSRLVSSGVDFDGKTIKLVSNINLNNKKWHPIGYPRNADGSRNPFKGTFDGCGYAIYNLAIVATDDWVGPIPDFAFFDQLEGATVKNVNFENVRVNDNRSVHGGVGAVSVIARNTIFTNISVSGRLSGNVCAAIALRAEDTTFYNCINRANFKIESFREDDTLMCGGIVAQLAISPQMAKRIKSRTVRVFEKCHQMGTIEVSANHKTKRIVLGHMYADFDNHFGNDKIVTPVNVLIDRCTVMGKGILLADHGYDIGRWGFFAKINDAVYGSNYSDPEGCKRDMLDGLIGFTPSQVGITVVKPTLSTVVNKLVIPGSLNTLRSEPGMRDFVTESSSPITDEDGVINMNPYYAYIKRVGI